MIGCPHWRLMIDQHYLLSRNPLKVLCGAEESCAHTQATFCSLSRNLSFCTQSGLDTRMEMSSAAVSVDLTTKRKPPRSGRSFLCTPRCLDTDTAARLRARLLVVIGDRGLNRDSPFRLWRPTTPDGIKKRLGPLLDRNGSTHRAEPARLLRPASRAGLLRPAALTADLNQPNFRYAELCQSIHALCRAAEQRRLLVGGEIGGGRLNAFHRTA